MVGKNSNSNTGECLINVVDSTNNTLFHIKPNGDIYNSTSKKYVAYQEDYIPRSGGAVITGAELGRTINTGALSLWGGTDHSDGAKIDLYGKGNPTYSGCAFIRTCDANNNIYQMALKPDGTLTWGAKSIAMQEDVVPRSGGAVIAGPLMRNVDNDALHLAGGSLYNRGADIWVFGNAHPTKAGAIQLMPYTGATGSDKYMWLKPDGTWTWSGQAVQITSDQRLKQQINQIDNKLLDAWEDVTPCQFKYNDAVEQKGNAARLHTGYVVQQIDEACKSHNVDISEYGLYCHEEYPERTEEIEVKQEDGTIKKETKILEQASEHYSLRYTETLVVECAYLRRENARLKERLQQHEDYFSNIEKRLQSLENS